MDVALTRVFKFKTNQAVRTSASRVPTCVIFDNLCKQFVPLDQTFCHNVLKAPRKQYNQMFPRTFFLREGGEILREINGQDHRTSMAKISASICSIWSRSLRSSECIGKQCSTHQQYVVENHKNTKQWVFGQTAQVHILLENLAYGQWWLRK